MIAKILTYSLISLTLAGGSTYAVGVRFNPEAISMGQSKEEYYKVDMKNGKTVIGKLIQKSDKEDITIEMGGGAVVISNAEIAKSTLLDTKDVEAGAYSEYMAAVPKKKVWSYSEKDNILIRFGWLKPKDPRLKAEMAKKRKGKSANQEIVEKLHNTIETMGSKSAGADYSDYSPPAEDSYQTMLNDTGSLEKPTFSKPTFSSSFTSKKSSAGTKATASGGTGNTGAKKTYPKGSYMDIVQRAMSPEAAMMQAQEMAKDMNATRNPIVECLKYGNCEKNE